MLSQEGIITSPIPEEQDPGPCIWAGAARAPRAHNSLGCSLSMGQVIQVRDPRGEELQLHHESWKIHAPSVLVSVLTVEVVCCLKGVSWYPGIGRGSRRGCAGENQRLKAVRSVTSMTLKILGQDPPVRLSTWGHSAVSPPVLAEPAGGLLQTPLGGSCFLWSLSAALGTQAACEYVRAGGVEDAFAVKGVF